eukprot:5561621-Amphidinium_carterae.2
MPRRSSRSHRNGCIGRRDLSSARLSNCVECAEELAVTVGRVGDTHPPLRIPSESCRADGGCGGLEHVRARIGQARGVGDDNLFCLQVLWIHLNGLTDWPMGSLWFCLREERDGCWNDEISTWICEWGLHVCIFRYGVKRASQMSSTLQQGHLRLMGQCCACDALVGQVEDSAKRSQCASGN